LPLRILLDVHIAPEVAHQLGALGIDAVAVSLWQDGTFREADDEAILRAAYKDRRTLATFDVSSIPKLIRQFANDEVDHFGVIFVNSKTIPHANIGALVRSVEKLARRYKQADPAQHGRLGAQSLIAPRQRRSRL